MKKLLLVAVCAMAVMMSCKNKGQSAAAEGVDSDSVAIDSVLAEMPDTAPPPMFLFDNGKKYMQLLYWYDIEEPKKTADMEKLEFENYHQSWALQDRFRRNAAQFTNLVSNGKTFKVKFVDEVLKDPDGNRPSIGQLHGRDEIPSLSARFEMVNAKEKLKNGWGFAAVVTDEYLATRKMLDIKEGRPSYDNPEKLPKDIVKKLEQQYNMKAERSCKVATIGGKYIWGAVQFKGAYAKAPKDKYDPDRKSSLALDVLIDGDKVYTHESLGYYDNEGPTWNVDDEGIYIPNNIIAAFEGPKGLELCYTHPAPESFEIGMIYALDGKLVECMYEMFQIMIDEDIPVWKKDIAEMNKLFQQKNKIAGIKLTKWAHPWMGDGVEWIHMADKDEEYGGIYIRKNGKIQLIQVEDPKRKATHLWLNGIAYLKFAGSAGGPSWYTEIIGYKDGKQVESFNMLEVEGEIDEAQFNGKTMAEEDARAYVEKFADAKPLNEYWNEPEK